MASYHERETVSTASTDDRATARHDTAVILSERRRAALAEVDNAKFSYVCLIDPQLGMSLIISQMVPRKGLHGRGSRVLYRCVRPYSRPLAALSLTLPPSYDIFAINIASTMLAYVYSHRR